MAPPKPTYNSVLTRANASRDKVLQDTGGLVEEPEFIELNPDLYGVSFEDDEAAKRFTDELVQKTGKNFRIKRFENLNRPEVNRDIESRVQPQLPKEEGQLTGFQPKSGMLLPEMKQQTPPKVSLMPEMYPEPRLVPEGTLMNAPSAEEMPSAPLSPEEAFSAPEEETPALPAEAVSPTQERLNALASILKMTEGDEAARRKAYERTAMDAETGKIMQAMMAGLTRSPVPSNVYEPTPAYQPEGRLSLLAKAAQALRGVQDVTERGVAGQNRLATESEKLWLKEKVPALYQTFEATGALDTMTEAEWRKYFDGYQGDVKGKRTVEQQEANRELRKELAKVQQSSDATKFISKQSEKVKTEAEAVPYLKQLTENKDVVESILSPGSTFRSKFAGGLLSTDEQQRFDQLVEGIAGPFRAGRFGMSQTSTELKNFEKLMGEADRTGNPVLRVIGLRDLIRSMRMRLRNTWAAARNADPESEIAKQYKAYEEVTGNTDNNPIFDELDKQLSDIIENAPAQQQTPWQKIKGAASETVKTVTGKKPTTAVSPSQATPSQTNKGIGQNEIVIYKKGQKPLIIPKSDYAAAKKDGWSLTPGDAQ